ncbi:MAG: response regulator [Thermodesulfobacteriota bacterium]
MRILLVEDDQMVGAAVVRNLKDASYAADWVRDGETALAAIAVQEYMVILLDLGLPKKDGFHILHAIRTRGEATPILIVTARDAVEDRVKGLDLGADDYLVKPFAMPELLARIRAVVRRKGGSAAPALSNGLLHLDMATHQLTAGGLTATLSAREFSLVEALLLRPGAILSRQQLEEAIYGWGEEIESNAVEAIIYSVRKKFGATTIKNVRGVGWKVEKPRD